MTREKTMDFVLMVPVDGDESPPLYRRLRTDEPEWEPVTRIMSLPYIRSFLRLGRASLNMLENRGERVIPHHFALRGSDPRPMMGFSLKEGGTHPTTPYTMLNSDQQILDGGGLEAILLHEYGHVIMYGLLGMSFLSRLPRPWNRMHLSTSVTDYSTAFIEGWGIHLECLSAQLSPTGPVKEQGWFDPSPFSHFLCRTEQRARINRVTANDFINRPLEAGVLARGSRDTHRVLAFQAAHGATDPSLLLGPQAMLSSEGVAASLFHRIACDPEVRAARQEPGFYRQFNTGGKTGTAPNPMENGYLKLFAAFRAMAEIPATEDLPALAAFIARYGQLFPEERENIYRIFIENTAGVTVSPDASPLYAELSFLGRTGDIPGLRRAGKEWNEMMGTALARSLNEPSPGRGLVELVGPELWLTSEEVTVSSAAWLPPDSPLVLNLNTCSATELSAVPGLSPGVSKALVDDRECSGEFRSIGDAVTRLGLPEKTAEVLQGCGKAFLDSPRKFCVS